MLTVEQFKNALPDKVRRTVNQELIDQINVTLPYPDYNFLQNAKLDFANTLYSISFLHSY